MEKYAIRIQDITKQYRVNANAQSVTRITEALGNSIRSIGKGPKYEIFQALNGVSFDVRVGEVVGIVGRNGAGKSTLLKVLSRITAPTSGQIELYGKIGSLLEVGSGFHPELSGRENIFLNGAILGMRRSEILRQFDEIVSFAEVEKFLDTPVKRYSSGMYVRLAFAVAAHLNPDILVVDEVLAVGDAQFQSKCLKKMQQVSRQDGRTVLFVSHNMATVEALCNRVVLLQKGQVAFDGGATEGVSEYTRSLLAQSGFNASRFKASDARVRILNFALTQDDGVTPPMAGRPLLATFEIEAAEDTSAYTVEYLILTGNGTRVSLANSMIQGETIRLKKGKNIVQCCTDNCHLVPGEYDIELKILEGVSNSFEDIDVVSLPQSLTVHPGAFFPSGMQPEQRFAGMVQFQTTWTAEHLLTSQ